MKRKVLPFLVIAGSLAAVYACSSSSDSTPGTTPTPEAGSSSGDTSTGDLDSSTGTDTSTAADTSVVTKTNPIEGVAAPKQVADALGFADGPQWFKDTLYVSRPLDFHLLRVNLVSGTVEDVRTGDGNTTGVIGNSIDKNNNLISAEHTLFTRTPADGGAVTTIASMYSDGDGGLFPFDTPNDLVTHPTSGTIYATDPGYNSALANPTNHLVRIMTDGGAFLLEDFPDAPRPNGIALTKDGSTLYISVTSPALGTTPGIRK
jgi:sugar lactone lactonase YvrE